MEAHEGIGEAVIELAGDVFLINVAGHAIVDIQQGDRVAADAQADVLAQRAVDVHLAGHRNAPGGQTGVHIAGLEAELLGEGRPALVRKGHILAAALVLLGPVQQSQLKLRHPGQQVGVVFALAHLGGHVGADLRDAGVVGMLAVGHQQVQLGVLLHFHAQLIQALDGGVAGEEVLGTGTKGDDLQPAHAQNGPGHGYELGHLVRQLLGGAHRILGDVSLQVAHAQIVGAVEHTAVGVAAAVDHVAVALSGRHEHAQGLGGLGAEVAQEHGEGVASGGPQIGHRLLHVVLVLHGNRALVEIQALGLAGGGDVLAALGGQCHREAVAAHRHDAQAYLRNVCRLHDRFLLFPY